MADNFLEQNQQLAAKLEATSGTAETLAAADVALKPFRSEFTFGTNYPRSTNDEVAEDLAQAADFVAGKLATIGVGFQCKTSGVLGTAPKIGPYLQGCGLIEEQVRQITIGTITGGGGIFLAGASYSATGGKTGTIEQDRNGAGVLRYVVTSGGDIANGDTITVGAGSATSSSATTAYAVKYRPRSSGLKTLTVQRAAKNDQGTANEDQLYRLRGAAGTGKITMAALDAMRFSAEFQGPVDFIGAGAFFTGVTYESSSAPKFVNSIVQINGVAGIPSSISLDFGNVIEVDPDPTTSGGTSGYIAARISRREPKIVIDPLRQKTSVLDDYGLLGAGTEVTFSAIVGTTPNLIEIAATKCQIREHSESVRAGRQAAGLTLFVNRSVLTDNDYALYFR
jgi:hypothetical protein